MNNNSASYVYITIGSRRVRVAVSLPVLMLLRELKREKDSQERKQRRGPKQMVSVDPETEDSILVPQEDIVDMLVRMEEYKRLHEALDKLSRIQRERLILHYVDGLTYRRIAVLHGVTEPTVAGSVKRAVELLRDYLSR